MVWKTLCILILVYIWLWGEECIRSCGLSSVQPNYYGMHLAANLNSNGTDLIISISWQLTWSSQSPPPNEFLHLMCDVYGNCPSGPSYIVLMPSTAYCTTLGTSYDGTPYLIWAGIDRQLSYPLSVIPLLPANSIATNDTNSSSLNLLIMDRD